MRAILTHLPETSALVREQRGEAAAWLLTPVLLAKAVDALNVANWQRGAKRGAAPPKPIPIPGTEPAGHVHKGDVLPIDEFAALIGWRGEPVT